MKAVNVSRKPTVNSVATGPSYFEVEYLRQLKEELEIFLKSRNFSTIREVQVAFAGADYAGLMKVHG
jgi:hypothetical protein